MDENRGALMHEGLGVLPIARRFSIRFPSIDEDHVHLRQRLHSSGKRVHRIPLEERERAPGFPQLSPHCMKRGATKKVKSIILYLFRRKVCERRLHHRSRIVPIPNPNLHDPSTRMVTDILVQKRMRSIPRHTGSRSVHSPYYYSLYEVMISS